jgi:spoIIIJ-associated protein
MSESEQELDEWGDEGEDVGTDEGEPEAGADDDGQRAEGGNGNGEENQGRRRRRRGNDEPDYIPEDDDRARDALEFVATVIREMEMDCRVRLRRPQDDDEDPEICIEISGPDSGRVIGKKGQVLTALQFLTHRVVNRSGLEKRHVLVDAEGYRSRRDSTLASMARRLGKQAVEQGKIITFEPMNPRDRRVVHLALAKFEGVITKSDGEGSSRRVQIIPVRRTTA